MEEEAIAKTGGDPKVDPKKVNGPDEDIGPNPLKGLPPFGLSLFNETTKVEWVECAWPRLRSYFTKNGLRCAFDLSEGVMGFWNPNATEGDEACVRAWYLIKMIATNNLHPSLALEITNGHRRNRHILIGSQKLGLCSTYGIDKEEFLKRRQRLIASKKTIYKLTCCSLYTSEDTVVVVGDDAVRIDAAEYLVYICIILGCHPVSVIKTIAVNERDNCGFCSGNIDFECFFSELEKGEIEQDDIFEPGDGLHHGPSSFTYPITENTENKCKEDRQKVESYLKDLDIAWTFDQDSMTVSTTNKCRKTCVKARLMLRLLARTDLSPSEAIDILNGSEQHAFIWIGNPKDSGLCSEFGISETEFNERVEWLKRSLQDIEQLTKCQTHLRGNTVTAAVTSVDNSEGLEIVRIIVESCIVHGVDPAQFMLRIKHTETDMPVERSPGEGSLGGPVTSFTEFFDEHKEERVLDAWPMAKLFTFKGVIAYSLDVAKHSMTASTTGKTKDIAKARRCLAKARRLLELLTTTDLPASLAIEIVAGLRKYVFIKIGTQEGGLCSKFGITEVEFMERRDRLMAHFKEIVKFAGCDLYIHENTATAVGTCVDPEDSLMMAKRLVEAFIVHNVAREWVKQVRERKYKAGGGGSGGDEKKRKRESQAETSKKPRPIPDPKGDLSAL